MTSKMFLDFVVFIAVSLCFQNDLGLAFNIVISPDTVNGLVHNDVTISCRLDKSDTKVKDVIFIDVSREGKAVAAFRKDLAQISIAGGLEDKYRGEGKLPTNVYDSYFNVTMLNPRLEDNGEYVCLLYYLDDTGLLKEKRTSANLTVTNEDMETALRFLVDEVASLKTELHKERNMSKGLLDEVASLTNQIKSIGNTAETDNSTVMFTAVHNAYETLYAQVLKFPTVIVNEGQGYNNRTGHFTAPVSGYYLFQMSLVTSSSSQRIFIELWTSRKTRIFSMIVGDRYYQDYSGGSGVAKLEAGDTVTPNIVHIESSPRLYHYRSGDRMNQFSGFLLKAL